LLSANEVWALDALPEEHNKFYEYLGYPKHVKYFHVTDFECAVLPDNHFNYMFSFGCLCHISFAGITAYAKTLFPKLQDGANCFWQVADYGKYNNAVNNLDTYGIWYNLPRERLGFFPLKWLFKLLALTQKAPQVDDDLTDKPAPGRWYNAGIDRTCAMLSGFGYEIIDRDVGTLLRDPIIHFRKPPPLRVRPEIL
jgi:hypothetical protein